MISFFKGMIKGLLIIAVIGAIVYYVSYNSWINEGFDKLGTGYNDTYQEKPVEVNYKTYYEKVNFKFLEDNFGSEFYDMYYSKGSFSNDYYLFVAIINMINKDLLTECNLNKELNGIEVEWTLRNIFGDVNFEKESFTTKDNKLSVVFKEEPNIFVVTANSCSGYDYKNGGIYTTATDAKFEGDYLYITEKAMYLENAYYTSGILTFNYHSGMTKEDPIIANNIDRIDLTKVPTYKLIFRKIDDSYKFIRVE